MATMILGAAGSALGGALGGSMAGLTTLALGKAAGATLGSMIDKRLLGLGAEPVETGRVNRFRVMGAGEGRASPAGLRSHACFGPDHLVEPLSRARRQPDRWGQGRWPADAAIQLFGQSGDCPLRGRDRARRSDLGGWRAGLATGFEQTPASGRRRSNTRSADRGDRGGGECAGLSRHGVSGHRESGSLALWKPNSAIPTSRSSGARSAICRTCRAIRRSMFGASALVPGTGEYSLATAPVYFERGKGQTDVANVHNDEGVADLVASLGHLPGRVAEHEIRFARGELVRRRPALRSLCVAPGGRTEAGRCENALAGFQRRTF